MAANQTNYKALSIFLSFVLIGCSPIGSNVYQDAAVGGVGGAAVGAGTGAAIGSIIANGDIAKSALLGGTIGLPAGILLGVALSNYTTGSEVDDNAEAIKTNQEKIRQQERELDYLRNEIRDDSSSKEVAPSPERLEHQYQGASLGNPFR